MLISHRWLLHTARGPPYPNYLFINPKISSPFFFPAEEDGELMRELFFRKKMLSKHSCWHVLKPNPLKATLMDETHIH